MAILKIISNNYRRDYALQTLLQYALFQKEYDANDRLIPNAVIPSAYIGSNNLFFGNPYINSAEYIVTTVYEQMMNTTMFYGKDYGQLLHHFQINFDSQNTESWITPEIAYEIAKKLCSLYPLNGYQTFFGIHTNRPSHLHIHIIVNSVNPYDGSKLPDKREFYEKLRKKITQILNEINPNTKNSCMTIYENCK